MSNSSKKRTRYGVLIFGISMAVVMVLSLMSGFLIQFSQRIAAQRAQQVAAQPTDVPTFEPPVSTANITVDRNVLQANGLFSVGVPEPPEWNAVESSYDVATNRARLLLRDSDNVVEVSMEAPAEPVESVAGLNDIYNDQLLGSSWRNYSDWRETQRTTVNRNGIDYLQMDFELEFRDRTYVARQNAWTDGNRVYSVRVVTPGNATDLLIFLLQTVTDNFNAYERFLDTPVNWSSHYDNARNHIIRFPDAWQVTDAAEGLPASIESDGISLRVEALAGESIASEDAAEDYAMSLPNVTEVTTVEAVDQSGTPGYAVTYTYQTLEGIAGTGYVTLLNGEDALHVANLRADDTATGATNYTQVMSTFSLLDGVEIAEEAFGSSAPLVEQPAAQPQGFPAGF